MEQYKPIPLKENKLNNFGFSLLELVVAVGVLLILTLIGLLSYNGITSNARQAAVESTASDFTKKIVAYKSDNDPVTTTEKALTEYNDTQKKDKDGSLPVSITLEEDYEKGVTRVIATHKLGKHSAVREISNTVPTGNGEIGGETGVPGDGSTPGDDNTVPPIVGSDPLMTSLTFVCDTEMTAILPVLNVEDDTIVTLNGEPIEYGTPPSGVNSTIYGMAPITNTSKPVTMNAGVTYELVVNGRFATLASTTNVSHTSNQQFNDCLISIDALGEDSGITHINKMGGKKFVGVPSQIPSSVVNLSAMFANATVFNNPNVSSWNTSNVENMGSLFSGAMSFNQPLDKWVTSKVTDMGSMFYGIPFSYDYSFNQDISKWDTSNVTNMSNMFRYNHSFNQDISEWNVSEVTNMMSMFESTKFNQDISKWDTSNVTNMSYMFKNNRSFNQDISGWNINKVTDMRSMFENTIFQQDLSSWELNSATRTGKFSLSNPFLSSDMKPFKNGIRITD